MRAWGATALALMLLASPLHAAGPTPAPVTANKVEGPVTGVVPDKITLSIDPHSSNSPNLQDKASLSVSFCTETSSMEKVLLDGKYVLQPRVYCNTPDRKLHLSGRRQSTGITMVPEMPGEWRWRSDYTLGFKPKKAWPVGQHYQLTFKQEMFPDQVKLNNGSYSLDTENLVPQIPEMEFFQDHENVEKKGVTTTIRFNSPVESEALKQHLEFILEELTDESKPNQRKVVAKAESRNTMQVIRSR